MVPQLGRLSTEFSLSTVEDCVEIVENLSKTRFKTQYTVGGKRQLSGPRKIHRNKALPVEERENSWESGGKAVEKCGKLPSAFLLREEEMPNLQNGNH